MKNFVRFLTLSLILAASPAMAGSMTLLGAGAVAVSAGGPASYSAVYGDCQDLGYGSTTYTAPSQTWGAGVAVVFVGAGSGPALTSVTIKGVSATKYTSASMTGSEAWYATITSGSGTVAAHAASVFNVTCSSGGVVTSTSSSPYAGSVYSNGYHSDPQTFTAATVPTGGIGISIITPSKSGALPAIWGGATRDSVTEAQVATGNTETIASAHTTSAGSFNPTVSGSGSGFGYSGSQTSIVTWGP